MCFGAIWFPKEQSFNVAGASTMTSMLAIASCALIIPAALYSTINQSTKPDFAQILVLSRGTSIVMLILYALFLVFQIKTHPELFLDAPPTPKKTNSTVSNDIAVPAEISTMAIEGSGGSTTVTEGSNGSITATEGSNGSTKATKDSKGSQKRLFKRSKKPKDPPPHSDDITGGIKYLTTQFEELSKTVDQLVETVAPSVEAPVVAEEEVARYTPYEAAFFMLVVTLMVSVCAEYLVSSIEGIVESTPLSKTFIGLILIPIVGNAAEHASAVLAAGNDKVCGFRAYRVFETNSYRWTLPLVSPLEAASRLPYLSPLSWLSLVGSLKSQ